MKKLSVGNELRITSIDKNAFISTFMPCPNGRRKFDMLRPGHSSMALLIVKIFVYTDTIILTSRITDVIESLSDICHRKFN